MGNYIFFDVLCANGLVRGVGRVESAQENSVKVVNEPVSAGECEAEYTADKRQVIQVGFTASHQDDVQILWRSRLGPFFLLPLKLQLNQLNHGRAIDKTQLSCFFNPPAVVWRALFYFCKQTAHPPSSCDDK